MNSHSFEPAQKSVLVMRQIASLSDRHGEEEDDPVAGEQVPAALREARIGGAEHDLQQVAAGHEAEEEQARRRCCNRGSA